MLDDLRTYLQLASGVTEATASKARDAVAGLVQQGLTLTTKTGPAPEMVSQVQDLADDLVATSKSNREQLLGLIRSEVDRAVGRMGFVREDELSALRRHVQRLEKQLADLEAAAAQTASEAPAAQTAPEAPADAAPEAPKVRKKRVLVVEEPGDTA